MAYDFTQPTDKDALNLTHAIALAESGSGGKPNYNAVGDNGTSHGAYQWQPGNYEAAAREAGFDPTDFSPETQDKVAYAQIKKYKDAGYDPGQIASLWNSGSPDNWKNHSGTTTINGKEIAYDTPAYVGRVKQNYQQIIGNPQSNIPDNPNIDTISDPMQSPELQQNIQDMQSKGKSQQEIQAYIQSVKSGEVTPENIPVAPPEPGMLSQVGEQFKEGGEKIVSSIEGGANRMNEGVNQFDQPGIMNQVEGATKAVQGVAQSFLGTFGGALQTVLSPVTPVVNAIIQDNLKHYHLEGVVSTIGQKLDGLAQKDPQNAGVIGDSINALLAALGEKVGAKKIKTEGFDVSNPLSSKSADELKLIPEDKVSKLSANEQKEWYRQQSKSMTQQAADATAKAQEAGQKSLEETKTQINDFNKQIAETSRTETTALKPKAQQLMRTSSQEYLSLTGEAVDGSPALSKTISSGDLSAKIDSKFEYNPEIGAAIKQDLGLDGAKELTNQQILDKARGIMQDVSKSARAGNTVYSPEEYAAMQKYSFLMETLGENGVDMTKANAFWKQWVPVRNRIVREIKPWDTETIGKQPFEGTLKKASVTAGTATQMASKLDAQNFISELETKMKLPAGTIGSDTRQLVEGLEKAKLSKDSIAQITKDALAKIKEDKVAALEKMSLAKYDTLKAARNRLIIKAVIVGALGLGAVKSIPVIGPAIKATEAMTGL
jgi:hypothetical protein